jgi:hypothetical protein
LWRAVGSGGDATGHLAALRSAGSAGYPVVFTSTLGLVPQGPAGLSNIRTLTQTPGVWLDCQVEDDMGGARISWDAATGIVSDEPLAAAFSHFERAVRRCAGQVDEVAGLVSSPAPQPGDSEWAGAVIAAAAGLCEAEQVRPEYAALVRRWRQLVKLGHIPAAGAGMGDTARAARRLADIVIGAASPQTLVGDPQLAPEAMLLADERLQWALDDLSERIFAHSRKVGRRLRIMEIGSRTGLITQRLTGMISAVVDEYLCFEPNPVLAEIAEGRDVKTATRQIASPQQVQRWRSWSVADHCTSFSMRGRCSMRSPSPTAAGCGWPRTARLPRQRWPARQFSTPACYRPGRCGRPISGGGLSHNTAGSRCR